MENYKQNIQKREVKILYESNGQTWICGDNPDDIICEIALDDYSNTQSIKHSKETDANALLITEAFNTLSVSGLTPAELWKQNQELIEVLKELYDFSQLSLSHIRIWRNSQNRNPELEEGIEKYSTKALAVIQNSKTK